jgi:type VI secretion system secreted protein VgrG
MNLDIHSAVQTSLLIILAAILISVWIGVQTIRSGAHLPFFRKRRDRMVRGWRMVFSGFALAVAAFCLNRYAEPVVYHFYPPTATITPTSTITPTPTITLTPTVTETPTITPTTSITPTPFIPPTLTAVFTSQVTPKPGAVFSQLSFTQKMNAQHLPVNPGTEFKNPVGHLYAAFSYNNMTDNAQWTALWYRGDELVYFESEPWNGGTGGYGYSDWNPPPEQWFPGDYAVYIFVGQEYVQGGYFKVVGNPPGFTGTLPAAAKPAAGASPTASVTRGPAPTATASSTPTITRTPTATRTRPPTSTMRPSLTPLPTDTHWPTATELPTPRPK